MTERSEQNALTELGSKPLLACPFCGGNAEQQDPCTYRINHEEGCILTVGIWYNYIIGPEQVSRWNQRANYVNR